MDDKEVTKLVLDIVAVADNNGLKLPREFGLLLKQVFYCCVFILFSFFFETKYFLLQKNVHCFP